MEAKFEEWKKGVTFKATDDNDDDTIEESSEVSDTTSERSELESDSGDVNAAGNKTTDAMKITLLNSIVRSSKEFDTKLFLSKMETIGQIPESLDHAQLK